MSEPSPPLSVSPSPVSPPSLPSSSPSRKALRCTSCSRLVTACNKEPCAGKVAKERRVIEPTGSEKAPPSSSGTPAQVALAPVPEFLLVTESEVNPKRLVQSSLNFGAVAPPSAPASVSESAPLFAETNAPDAGFVVASLSPPTWVKLEVSSLALGTPEAPSPAPRAPSPSEIAATETLLRALVAERVLFQRAHLARVVSADARGLCVDVTVERLAEDNALLTGQHVLWHDFPDEVRAWSPEQQLTRTQRFLGAGSELHAQAQPKLRIPLPGPDVIVTPRCPFPYLVIADFEATCDYAPKPAVTAETAEIIEFPWVVLDTRTLCLVDQQRFYVRPESLSSVTHYTTLLTGIEVRTLTDAPSLALVLKHFTDYITHHFQNDRTLFRVVTDGIWDLQVQLRWEARRKGLLLPWYLNEFFDLQEEFRNLLPWFPTEFRCNLQAMLRAFGYEFRGRAHSGLDDSLNIARVTASLLALDHPFNKPRVIPPLYDAHADPKFLDFGSQAEPNSWLCATCNVWNRPWMHYCRFCEERRRSDSASLPLYFVEEGHDLGDDETSFQEDRIETPRTLSKE